MPAPKKPPAHVNLLRKFVSDHVKAEARQDEGLVERRYQRWLGFMIVSAILDQVRDEGGDPVFLLKGGVAMELRLGLSARATKDYDAAFRERSGNLVERLDDALAAGFGDFGGTRTEIEDIRETGAKRTDLKLTYKGRSWQTVRLEVAPSEGEAGQEIDRVPAIPMDPVGLEGPREVPCVAVRYQIAQKLHACTTEPGRGRQNDRSRDLIDLLLLRDLLREQSADHGAELGGLRAACEEIFDLRAKQTWPPTIRVHENWRETYPREAADLRFPITDVDEAQRLTQRFVHDIDTARQITVTSSESVGGCGGPATS
jgi:hypothetical protein